MIHPDTELRYVSKEVGFGVFATKLIPKGSITWALDPFDKIIPKDDFETIDSVMWPMAHKYTYRDQNGDYVLCWDISKYVNHSFHCNCMSTFYDLEIAIRDILPGEQLTDDYGFLNNDEPFKCLPEKGTQRTHVMPDDLLTYYKEWDEQLISAFSAFTSVAQPLQSLLKPETLATCIGISEGKEPMDSILNLYYDVNNVLKGKRNLKVQSGILINR